MGNRTAVVNCVPRGRRYYNLGARKLTNWLREQGDTVDYFDGDPGPIFTLGYDRVCLSVVFSWHAPIAAEIARRVKHASEVWCGGPGMTNVRAWWQQETGLGCHVGLDQRFERQAGDYLMTFASRGCPVGCYFCIVPRIEGRTFTLYWDFVPAPILCDNNLSALPADFQDHIIARYMESGVKLADANSGFEPKPFTEETYQRWRAIVPVWRFAFDETAEEDDVRRMMRILRDVSPRRKQVYVLVGNEPITACYERAMKVIEWGGEPYCQFIKPLNYLGGPLPVRYDWTEQLGRDFCRYFNRHLWRSLALTDYSERAGERPPFADVLAKEPLAS